MALGVAGLGMDLKQMKFEARDAFDSWVTDQRSGGKGGAMSLFMLPVEYIFAIKGRVATGVSWGNEHGSMALAYEVQKHDICCILPAVPIIQVCPAEQPDWRRADQAHINCGFDPFLATDVKRNWLTTLTHTHKLTNPPKVRSLVESVDRTTAAAESILSREATCLPLCVHRTCFDYVIPYRDCVQHGGLHTVASAVAREDVAVFRPLGFALNFHAGRRKGCCGFPLCPIDTVPEFFFLTVTPIDVDTARLFVDEDLWTRSVDMPRSPGGSYCTCPGCGVLLAVLRNFHILHPSRYSLQSSLFTPREVWSPVLRPKGMFKSFFAGSSKRSPVDDEPVVKPSVVEESAVIVGGKTYEVHRAVSDESPLKKKEPRKRAPPPWANCFGKRKPGAAPEPEPADEPAPAPVAMAAYRGRDADGHIEAPAHDEAPEAEAIGDRDADGDGHHHHHHHKKKHRHRDDNHRSNKHDHHGEHKKKHHHREHRREENDKKHHHDQYANQPKPVPIPAENRWDTKKPALKPVEQKHNRLYVVTHS